MLITLMLKIQFMNISDLIRHCTKSRVYIPLLIGFVGQHHRLPHHHVHCCVVQSVVVLVHFIRCVATIPTLVPSLIATLSTALVALVLARNHEGRRTLHPPPPPAHTAHDNRDEDDAAEQRAHGNDEVDPPEGPNVVVVVVVVVAAHLRRGAGRRRAVPEHIAARPRTVLDDAARTHQEYQQLQLYRLQVLHQNSRVIASSTSKSTQTQAINKFSINIDKDKDKHQSIQ